MGIADTVEWFQLAVPNPTEDNKSVQLGVHLEEVAEMAEAFQIKELQNYLHLWGNNFKEKLIPVPEVDRKALLDALCDQIVTACGVAHMYGMDIVGAFDQVNKSNFSKFEDGKPVFKANGKIGKGKDYFSPDLEPYL
jgi:predicted HAD superfamily Cof-like phosphohydrolase